MNINYTVGLHRGMFRVYKEVDHKAVEVMGEFEKAEDAQRLKVQLFNAAWMRRHTTERLNREIR